MPGAIDALSLGPLQLELEAGHVDSATAHFRAAIRLDPHDALALSSLGSIRLQQGDRTEATALFRRALESDPQNAEARAGLKALGVSATP